MTTKQCVLRSLEGRQFVSGSELESFATIWGTKASTISRRCRELYEGGQLDRKLVKGCVWYKKRPLVMHVTKSGLGWLEPEPNQLFETAPPRFTMDPLTKKAKQMAKLLTFEIYEDGEFVFGALMDSDSCLELEKLADKLSDESVLNATPEEMKAALNLKAKQENIEDD